MWRERRKQRWLIRSVNQVFQNQNKEKKLQEVANFEMKIIQVCTSW